MFITLATIMLPPLGAPKKKPEAIQPLACAFDGGDDGDRTHDLRLAMPALSQLSYIPTSSNKRPSGDSAHAGAFIVKDGGPDKVRTCDLTVISRAL